MAVLLSVHRIYITWWDANSIELRRTMEIEEKDSTEISVESERIILQEHAPACLFYGTAGQLVPFRGKSICRLCRGEIMRDVPRGVVKPEW